MWKIPGSSISYFEYLRRQPHLWSDHSLWPRIFKNSAFICLCKAELPVPSSWTTQDSTDRDFGLPFHYKEENLSPLPWKTLLPHISNRRLPVVFTWKTTKHWHEAWERGEEKCCVLKQFVGSGLAAMLLLGKNIKLWV